MILQKVASRIASSRIGGYRLREHWGRAQRNGREIRGTSPACLGERFLAPPGPPGAGWHRAGRAKAGLDRRDAKKGRTAKDLRAAAGTRKGDDGQGAA